jgi:BirA family transcriptional regulator, biotin operon repressor / biotin---[acetyl-CoA-carboxylase] ligase
METLFIGKNPIFLPQTESTNSYAISLLKNVNPMEGTVVHAAHQTEGRGQRGTSWNSDPHSNLAASVILKPTFLEIKNHFYLYKIAALACFDTMAQILEKRQFDIRIKWPNDILVNNRKICGILVENGISGRHLSYSVVGVGMNLNQQEFGDLDKAVSYRMLTGEEIAGQYVLCMLCKNLERWYMALKQNRLTHIADRYRSCLFALDKKREFEINDQRRQLTVKGVSDNGLLHLESENGEMLEADVKEIRWVL